MAGFASSLIGMITPSTSTTSSTPDKVPVIVNADQALVNRVQLIPFGATDSSLETDSVSRRWWCTITDIYGKTMEDLERSEMEIGNTMAHAAAQVQFITGQSVVFQTEIVSPINQSQDPKNYIQVHKLKISGPMVNVPYYKDIVIAFVRILASKLQKSSFKVYFDSVPENLDSVPENLDIEEPSWLYEIKQAQDSELANHEVPKLYKSRTWSLDINFTDDSWPQAVIPALRFVSLRNNVVLNCELPVNGSFTLSNSHPAESTDCESAANDLAKYLKILKFNGSGVQDIVWRDTECFSWTK